MSEQLSLDLAKSNDSEQIVPQQAEDIIHETQNFEPLDYQLAFWMIINITWLIINRIPY